MKDITSVYLCNLPVWLIQIRAYVNPIILDNACILCIIIVTGIKIINAYFLNIDILSKIIIFKCKYKKWYY